MFSLNMLSSEALRGSEALGGSDAVVESKGAEEVELSGSTVDTWVFSGAGSIMLDVAGCTLARGLGEIRQTTRGSAFLALTSIRREPLVPHGLVPYFPVSLLSS